MLVLVKTGRGREQDGDVHREEAGYPLTFGPTVSNLSIQLVPVILSYVGVVCAGNDSWERTMVIAVWVEVEVIGAR